MRVVFLIEDSLPNRWVKRETTPNLVALAEEGARSEVGGRAVLSTATYPNHASFITGAEPTAHGILTNDVWDGERFVCSSKIGLRVENLFQAARRHGVTTAAVLGDQKLVGVMGAEEADWHWPPKGRLPDGTQQDEFGFASDTAVVDVIDKTAALDADLVVLHLNEPDSACHLFGPDSEESQERFRRTDQALGEIVERLRERWAETLLFIVSDHDQESLLEEPPINLAEVLQTRGLSGEVAYEGTAAQIVDAPELADLHALPMIEGGVEIAPRHALVWGSPGRSFGAVDWGLKGGHGSPRTDVQVAVVCGGHPRCAAVAKSLRVRRPSACDWTPTIASLYGLSLPEATGASLAP